MSHTRVRLSAPTESLRLEHRKIRELLREYSALPLDDRNRREEIFDQIHRLLLLHFALEEEILYPTLRRTGTEQAAESVEDAQWGHRLLRQLLTELSQMNAQERAFDSKLNVLRMNLEYYMDAEERNVFPEVRELGREMRETLLQELEGLRNAMLDQEGKG